MTRFLKSLVAMLFIAGTIGLVGCSSKSDKPDTKPNTPAPTAKKHFRVGVSIYSGWMPWYHANSNGKLKAWADAYNLEIEFIPYADYPSSLDAYSAGKIDALVATNMDSLAIAAASGIETTSIVMGDFSNGNDAVLVRNGLNVAALKGKTVYLVEKTVSQYMLVRFLEQNGLSEKDVNIVNVSDSDIAPQFMASKTQEVVVTWNPMVMEIKAKTNGVGQIFDSSKIPGEIQDLLVVNTKVLNGTPDLGRALVGAWYETLSEMTQRGPVMEGALKSMADLSKCSLEEFKGQMSTTAMFYTADKASEFTKSKENKDKNDMVRKFCASHSLLGDKVTNADEVGIRYPDGTIQGSAANVKFNHSAQFMDEYAAGKIKR
jgi:NitT/TauT family transport system substrate-binding protein